MRQPGHMCVQVRGWVAQARVPWLQMRHGAGCVREGPAATVCILNVVTPPLTCVQGLGLFQAAAAGARHEHVHVGQPFHGAPPGRLPRPGRAGELRLRSADVPDLFTSMHEHTGCRQSRLFVHR